MRKAILAVLVALCCWVPCERASAGQNDFGLYLETVRGLVPLPVHETRVRGTVQGIVATIDVTQVYVNPYDQAIEATYVFPLPERAAVTAMVMRLGGREVVAKIREREEAQRVYRDAVNAGQTAALMTQQRPNIFTQKVGNILPGHEVEVELRYIEALPYSEGVSELVFPTVVGPRFIPGEPLDGAQLDPHGRIADTHRVDDASAITPPTLAAGATSAQRIDLQLDIDPQLPIASIDSPSHRIRVDRFAAQRAQVAIEYGDRIPNKDFILRIDVRSAAPTAALLAHRNGDDGYVTLALQPPSHPTADAIAAKDLFFVIDNSGSMRGLPLQAAKDLVRLALHNLNPSDRFTIMRFSDSVSALSATPLTNTRENVEAGLDFIDAMQGMGGTHMLSGVRRALEGAVQPGRMRMVFFLTDGYIGNDREILAAVQSENEAGARLFSLGVGSSVNRYLLRGMARLGRGEFWAMRFDQDPGPFVQRFYRRVRNPVLTDVEIDWGNAEVYDASPAFLPDLFDGQPLVVHGRYRRSGEHAVTIRGRLGGRPWSQQLSVELPAASENRAVANLWARARIAELMDEETVRPGQSRDEILGLALQHSLMSAYTAFVAVDHHVTRDPGRPMIPVAQWLPLPEGVHRFALGSLSRRRIPPGDPILSIAAPADARRVTALFPFGLVKQLRYDPGRALWRARFLVPAGIADGRYEIVVRIELADGRTLVRREPYHLDSQAQEFIVDFATQTLVPGGDLLIEVDAVEPADEVYVHLPELGWSRIELSSGDDGIRWWGHLPIAADAAPGTYDLMVVVRDAAGNRLQQMSSLTLDFGGSRGVLR